MRARVVYDVGILAFLLAIAALLTPLGDFADASYARMGVVGVALLGFALEALWVAWTYRGSEEVVLPDVGPESPS